MVSTSLKLFQLSEPVMQSVSAERKVRSLNMEVPVRSPGKIHLRVSYSAAIVIDTKL